MRYEKANTQIELQERRRIENALAAIISLSEPARRLLSTEGFAECGYDNGYTVLAGDRSEVVGPTAGTADVDLEDVTFEWPHGQCMGLRRFAPFSLLLLNGLQNLITEQTPLAGLRFLFRTALANKFAGSA